MAYDNPFILETSQYKRDLQVMKHYVNDAARYLSIRTGSCYEECRAFVLKTIKPGGALQITDPIVKHTSRENYADIEIKEIPLSQYLRETIQNKDIITPTLTTYLHPSIKKSLQVDFVDANVKRRSKAKKEMFAAKMDKNEELRIYKFNEQSYAKTGNNSLSGAYSSGSTPLYNKTAHSSLTSTCRTTSGNANANNEKLLVGNRHYWCPDIVINNVMSVINHTDYEQLETTITKYNMYFPTSEDMVDCIKYSTDLYWHSKKEIENIADLAIKLTPIQRAAFMYTGDLFHIAKHNAGIVRTFITKLSSKIDTPHPDPDSIFAIVPEDFRCLAVQICEKESKGKKLEDLKGSDDYGIIASTCENILNTVTEYADFIKTFFVTTNIPASLAQFPNSIRRSAVTSDTDSTIFTVQDWVKWYYGDLVFGPKANKIIATMVFISSQTIIHILALMSANIGVETKRLFQIAMKNEFRFDVFITAQVAKHYYALIGYQEGNVFDEFKEEIKGVHLKSSNVPKELMAKAKEMMLRVMNTIVVGKKLNLSSLLKEIGDIERTIMAGIKSGSFQYFRGAQIKSSDSYKKGPKESNYLHYTFWNEVFGPKYGLAPPPPYGAIKINSTLENKTQLQQWLSGIEDKELLARLKNWMDNRGGRFIKTFYLPIQVVGSVGIPDELMRIIDTRRIISDTAKVFYIILESLGFYITNNNSHLNLISDRY